MVSQSGPLTNRVTLENFPKLSGSSQCRHGDSIRGRRQHTTEYGVLGVIKAVKNFVKPSLVVPPMYFGQY